MLERGCGMQGMRRMGWNVTSVFENNYMSKKSSPPSSFFCFGFRFCFSLPFSSNSPYVVRNTLNSVLLFSWLHISCCSGFSFWMNYSVSTSSAFSHL